MRRVPRKQTGAVLIVTLLMLVVISLLAVSAVNNSTVNLRIVDNMRTVQEEEAAILQAIEIVISDPNHFHDPQELNVPVYGHGDLRVTVEPPRCVMYLPGEGSSAQVEGTQDVTPPEQTYWEYTAYLSDEGARISQGVRMRMLAGRCEQNVGNGNDEGEENEES